MLQRLRRQNKLHLKEYGLIFLGIVLVGLFVLSLFLTNHKKVQKVKPVGNKFTNIVNKKLPTLSPSPTPTPKPLTFKEINALYGPCTYLPTLMYHHIQSKDSAVINKQTGLTVYTDVFKTQMEYLKSENYNTLTMSDLINFFDSGTSVSPKSVLLTFDDGYQDFYTDAYPILSSLGFKSTVFVPTGLMQNPDYLTWDEISGMTSSVLFANHTWSHKSVSGNTLAVVQNEISTADRQLADHGLNSPKTFAYPYGPATIASENYLNSIGYKLAFTTTPGSTLCKKQRLALPRIRIGNTSLSSYGF